MQQSHLQGVHRVSANDPRRRYERDPIQPRGAGKEGVPRDPQAWSNGTPVIRAFGIDELEFGRRTAIYDNRCGTSSGICSQGVRKPIHAKLPRIVVANSLHASVVRSKHRGFHPEDARCPLDQGLRHCWHHRANRYRFQYAAPAGFQQWRKKHGVLVSSCSRIRADPPRTRPTIISRPQTKYGVGVANVNAK
jgi:hypothetical protein